MGGKKKAKIEIPVGDPETGKSIFTTQCASCHGLSGNGKGASAPPLGGLVGRKAGSTEFAYSKAIKGSGLIWTKENLFKYIQNPGKFLPGNMMSFGGISSEADRADLIAYLENPN